MEETTSYRSVLSLVAVGALAVFLVWWFGFRADMEVAESPSAPAVVKNVLPDDLRVFSGKVTGKTGNTIQVEWVVPGKTDLSEAKTVTKTVSWNTDSVFELTRVGESNSGLEKAKPADLKVGQVVLVVATTPVQASDSLTAEKIQIVLPPELP